MHKSRPTAQRGTAPVVGPRPSRGRKALNRVSGGLRALRTHVSGLWADKAWRSRVLKRAGNAVVFAGLASGAIGDRVPQEIRARQASAYALELQMKQLGERAEQIRKQPGLRADTPIALAKGEPVISAEALEAELASIRSPLAGKGLSQAFVDAGVAHGIRPEVGLLFFRMESNAGLVGRAIENKSIGNIRFSPTRPPGIAYEKGAGGFRRYPTWEMGARDFFRMIREAYVDKGGVTLGDIVPDYAPRGDRNKPDRYLSTVLGFSNELAGHERDVLERWIAQLRAKREKLK